MNIFNIWLKWRTAARSRRLARLQANAAPVAPRCECFGDDEEPPESGPFYRHLGVAPSFADMQRLLEKRAGLPVGPKMRIVRLRHCRRAAKTKAGCPAAKWIVRRSSPEEKMVFAVRHRSGHVCRTAWMLVSVLVWDAIPEEMADVMYDVARVQVGRFGIATSRRCGANEDKSCACQGEHPLFCGVSANFGCTYQPACNGCKLAATTGKKRKFGCLKGGDADELAAKADDLATVLAPLLAQLAPEAYGNMTAFEDVAGPCRLGRADNGFARPFGAVTCVCDFCSHAHLDINNMQEGCTMVVTLQKESHRGDGPVDPEEEQLHVLPLNAPEFGYEKGPGLETLSKFHRTITTRRDGEIVTEETDCEDLFPDLEIGGLAFGLTHRSVLIEAARHELHATTALRHPNRCFPSRLGLVYYQGKYLTAAAHGHAEWFERREKHLEGLYRDWAGGALVPSPMQKSWLRAFMARRNWSAPAEIPVAVP